MISAEIKFDQIVFAQIIDEKIFIKLKDGKIIEGEKNEVLKQ